MPLSTNDGDTECFGYLSHTHAITQQTPMDSNIIVFIIEIFSPENKILILDKQRFLL